MRVTIAPNMEYDLWYLINHMIETADNIVSSGYGLEEEKEITVNYNPRRGRKSICLTWNILKSILDDFGKGNYTVEIKGCRHSNTHRTLYHLVIGVSSLQIAVDASWGDMIIAVVRDAKRYVVRSISDLYRSIFWISELYGYGTTSIRSETWGLWYDIKTFISEHIVSKLPRLHTISNLIKIDLKEDDVAQDNNINPIPKDDSYRKNRRSYIDYSVSTEIDPAVEETFLAREKERWESLPAQTENTHDRLLSEILHSLKRGNYKVIRKSIACNPQLYQLYSIRSKTHELSFEGYESYSDILKFGPVVYGILKVGNHLLHFAHRNLSSVWVWRSEENHNFILLGDVKAVASFSENTPFLPNIELKGHREILSDLLEKAVDVMPTSKYFSMSEDKPEFLIWNRFIQKYTEKQKKLKEETMLSSNAEGAAIPSPNTLSNKKNTSSTFQRSKKLRKYEIKLMNEWCMSRKSFKEIERENGVPPHTLSRLMRSIPDYDGTRKSIKKLLSTIC